MLIWPGVAYRIRHPSGSLYLQMASEPRPGTRRSPVYLAPRVEETSQLWELKYLAAARVPVQPSTIPKYAYVRP